MPVGQVKEHRLSDAADGKQPERGPGAIPTEVG
jgi:hypothetical protein